MERVIADRTVELLRGDITKQDVDCIVNAANSSLLGGGGVDGAIHRAGGPAILAACRAIRSKQGGCPPGEAVITTGGLLKARRVIHTVGPVWRGGSCGEPDILAACYRNSLGLAAREGIRTIAFPSIGTGAYGYPVEAAADVAVGSVAAFLKGESVAPDLVRFVLFDGGTWSAYAAALETVSP